MSLERLSIQQPPKYCQYAGGQCDESFSGIKPIEGLILYPNEPREIANVIEESLTIVRKGTYPQTWLTWKEINVGGQVIFCKICKSLRHTNLVVADVTTLNFNLLFEIGYAIGLELPVLPIRDSTYERDHKDFEEFGLLDTVGYFDFQNANSLADCLMAESRPSPISTPRTEINRSAPIYLVKSPIALESQIKLQAKLKKSSVHFRTYDANETPRISLHELRKNVGSSLAVITELLSPERSGSKVHNAKCALTAGLAMAADKIVLMIEPNGMVQPIDYRDVVKSFRTVDQISSLCDETIVRVIRKLQESDKVRQVTPSGLLSTIDIGDIAAENEVQSLRSYFMETGQFLQAKRGHARLIVGRKGSGKTAIFCALVDAFGSSKSQLVLDLMPEGHQFAKLKETLLSKMPVGYSEHTLIAFWNCILLTEFVHKIATEESAWAQKDNDRLEKYLEVVRLYRECGIAEQGDFAERLLNHIDRLVDAYEDMGCPVTPRDLTERLYSSDVPRLGNSVCDYLTEKQQVWLLVDNLDKGWPTHGATEDDILILRSLLEATRKLQKQLDKLGVEFNSLVFLRNDIYEHLLQLTSDKGKDTPIELDWSDPELFKELFRLRALNSGNIQGDFQGIWGALFPPNVGSQGSFEYVLERTLMRPRDLLQFVHRAIEVAINRGNTSIQEDDLRRAEKLYSEDVLKTTSFELRDVFPEIPDFLYVFLGSRARMNRNEALAALREAKLSERQAQKAMELLLWYGFLGVQMGDHDDPKYSFMVRYDMTRLMSLLEKKGAFLTIHLAYQSALECIVD